MYGQPFIRDPKKDTAELEEAWHMARRMLEWAETRGIERNLDYYRRKEEAARIAFRRRVESENP